MKVLKGEMSLVRRSLEKEMKKKALNQEFEKAKVIRDQIQKLNYITQPITPIRDFLINPNFFKDLRNEEIDQLKKILKKYIAIPKTLKRIECYDIAHISGQFSTASMVTFINGVAEKKFYRHFRIRQGKKASDTDSLAEVARRRKKYLASWGRPDLILVDGGKGQVSSFLNILAKENIPVIGFAKRTNHLVIFTKEKERKFIQIKLAFCPAFFLIQRMRDESHRFAQKYYHKLLSKSLTKR